MAVLARLRARARLLKAELFTLVHAARDPRTPLLPKLVVFVVLAYALSPVDLVPDFIPVLGLLDDLVLVPLGISLAIRLIPRPVLVDARARAEVTAARFKRFAAFGLLLTVLLWLAVAVLIVLAVRAFFPAAN